MKFPLALLFLAIVSVYASVSDGTRHLSRAHGNSSNKTYELYSTEYTTETPTTETPEPSESPSDEGASHVPEETGSDTYEQFLTRYTTKTPSTESPEPSESQSDEVALHVYQSFNGEKFVLPLALYPHQMDNSLSEMFTKSGDGTSETFWYGIYLDWIDVVKIDSEKILMDKNVKTVTNWDFPRSRVRLFCFFKFEEREYLLPIKYDYDTFKRILDFKGMANDLLDSERKEYALKFTYDDGFYGFSFGDEENSTVELPQLPETGLPVEMQQYNDRFYGFSFDDEENSTVELPETAMPVEMQQYNTTTKITPQVHRSQPARVSLAVPFNGQRYELSLAIDQNQFDENLTAIFEGKSDSYGSGEFNATKKFEYSINPYLVNLVRINSTEILADKNIKQVTNGDYPRSFTRVFFLIEVAERGYLIPIKYHYVTYDLISELTDDDLLDFSEKKEYAFQLSFSPELLAIEPATTLALEFTDDDLLDLSEPSTTVPSTSVPSTTESSISRFGTQL